MQIYVGSRPVRDTIQSATILYRVFCCLNLSNLTIVEFGDAAPEDTRVPGATYMGFKCPLPQQRIFRTRLAPLAYAVYDFYMALVALGYLLIKLRGRPTIITTIAISWGWRTAYLFARITGSKLQIIIHDNLAWRSYGDIPPRLTDRFFMSCLKYCDKVYVVSDEMGDYVTNLFGVPTRTLLPTRAVLDKPRTEAPGLGKRKRRSRPIVLGHSGTASMHCVKTVEYLSCNYPDDIKIVMTGPNRECFRESGMLVRCNVEHLGLFGKPADAIEALSVEADFMLLTHPPLEHEFFRYSFPSKFSDYTLIGVPVVLCAEAESPIARFFSKSGMSDMWVGMEIQRIFPLIARTYDDARLYNTYCARIRDLGEEYFSCKSVLSAFTSDL